jgi:hypothetical protein
MIDPAHAEAIATQLDALAARATPLEPAYGDPASLATLVRDRAAGGCTPFTKPLDFFAAYHVPLFAKWARCELSR